MFGAASVSSAVGPAASSARRIFSAFIDSRELTVNTLPALLLAPLTLALVAGCATGTDGPVEIGPDMYMIGGHGKYTDFSGSAVKARFYQDASQYCRGKNRVMLPVNSTGQDSGFGTYASAEVQFRCLLPNDPRLPK